MPPRRNPATGPNELEIGEGSVHPKPMDIPVNEAPFLGSQVMDTIGQLVSAIDRDWVARQPTEGIGCSLNDFYSHHLESCDGRGDLIRAKNGLNDVEELLATLGCTNEQKVAYAAYKRWWQDNKVVLVFRDCHFLGSL
jgi:hypothetical protein